MFKGAILIILMAGFMGSGYFFAAKKLDNHNFLASLPAFSGDYQLVEEIPLRNSENVVKNTSRRMITENTILPENKPKRKDVENDDQDTKDKVKEIIAAPIKKDCSLVETKIASSSPIIINEVAWAGTAADKTSHEWIELKNISTSTVHLDGWQLVNKSGVLKVTFDEDDLIAAGGYFLLERTDDEAVLGLFADKIFVNAIKNSDESLILINKDCLMADKIETGDDQSWLFGQASSDYRTMERATDLTWHTYSGSGTNGILGTPKAENSPVVANEIVVVSATDNNFGASGNSGVSDNGSGSSLPSPSPLSPFSPSLPPLSSPIPNMGTIYISEVMVGIDGNADYEFVEIYNPNANDIDLTGWSMKKKSSSGTESSLMAISRLEGKIIKAGKYLLFAREESYNGSVVPDVKWASSYSLAYTNNVVILYNTRGEKVDETSWTEIPKGQSWERDSWSVSQFHLQAVPNPQNANN